MIGNWLGANLHIMTLVDAQRDALSFRNLLLTACQVAIIGVALSDVAAIRRAAVSLAVGSQS